MATQVQDAVEATEVPDDMLLYGAVVAIGCDAPTDVHGHRHRLRAVITAAEGAEPDAGVLRADDHGRAGAGPAASVS